MPIPEELMPQSKPEEQKPDIPKSGNIEVGASREQANKATIEQGNKKTKEQKNRETEKQKNIKTLEHENIETQEQSNKVTKDQNPNSDSIIKQSNNLTIPPKKRINFSWMAKHLLPIFLFVILAATVSIAAVPSWRNSFNKFIAKWSPKADETQSDNCTKFLSNWTVDIITTGQNPPVYFGGPFDYNHPVPYAHRKAKNPEYYLDEPFYYEYNESLHFTSVTYSEAGYTWTATYNGCSYSGLSPNIKHDEPPEEHVIKARVSSSVKDLGIGLSEEWPLNGDYYEVPTLKNKDDKTPRTVAVVSMSDRNGNVQRDKAIDVSLQYEEGEKGVSIVDENNKDITQFITDNDGKVMFYLKSTAAAKVKVKANYVGFENDIAKEKGIEFAPQEASVEITKVCATMDTSNWAKLNEFIANPSSAINNANQDSWFSKLINKTKNKVFSILGLNDKAYSENSADEITLCSGEGLADRLDTLPEEDIITSGDVATKSEDAEKEAISDKNPTYIASEDSTIEENIVAQAVKPDSKNGLITQVISYNLNPNPMWYKITDKDVAVAFAEKEKTEAKLKINGLLIYDYKIIETKHNYEPMYALYRRISISVEIKDPNAKHGTNMKKETSLKIKPSQGYLTCKKNYLYCLKYPEQYPEYTPGQLENFCNAEFRNCLNSMKVSTQELQQGEDFLRETTKKKILERMKQQETGMEEKENQGKTVVRLYLVEDEEVTSSNVIKSAHAETEPKITELASASQTIYYDQYADTPAVKIEKIARDLNNDGNIDEKTETLNSPLGENGFVLDALKEHINDSEYLKKNNYFEVYPNQEENFDAGNPLSSSIEKSYQEKVYPGDKIYLSTKYKKGDSTIYNTNLFVGADSAASNNAIEKLGAADGDKLTKSDTNPNLYKRLYPEINEDKEIKWWVQLKNDINLDTKSINFISAIGKEKPKGDIYYSKISKDLFGFVEGKVQTWDRRVTGGNVYVPRAYVELLSQQDEKGKYDTTYTLKKERNQLNLSDQKTVSDKKAIKEYAENHYTYYDAKDENNPRNGKFFLEYNRNKDLLYNNNIKFKVVLKDYKIKDYPSAEDIDLDDYEVGMYQSAKTNWQDIDNSDLVSDKEIYIITAAQTIPSKTKVFSQDISLDYINMKPKWDYPNMSLAEYSPQKVHSGALIYSNLIKAKYFLNNNISSITNIIPKTNVVLAMDNEEEAAYFRKKDFIGIGKKNWDQPAIKKSPQNEFHELGHQIFDKVFNFKEYIPFTKECSKCPDDKIPYKEFNANHYGWFNDSTSDSLNEGWATFFSVWLNRKTDKTFTAWNTMSYSGNTGANLDTLYPIIAPVEGASPWILKGKLFLLEEVATAEIFKELVSGTPWGQLNHFYDWTGTYNSNDIASPVIDEMHDTVEFDKMVGNFINNKINTINDLYKVYKAQAAQAAGLVIDGLFLLHGVFHDTNCDLCYQSPEIIGEPTSDSGFEGEIRLNGKDVDWEGQLGPRGDWRKSPPLISGAYVKVNLTSSANEIVDEGKIKVKIVFDSPYESFNYENIYDVSNGQLEYIVLPFEIYQTKAVITAENSSDYMVIDSEKYWDAINTGMFNYFAEKTFTLNNQSPPSTEEIINKSEPSPAPFPAETPISTPTPSSSPASTPTVTPTVTSTPSSSPAVGGPTVSIVDDEGNKTANVGGGGTVNVEAKGFDKTEKVDIYAGDKKVAENIPLVSDSFGLKVDVPNNIGLGNKTIKLLGNTGQKAETEIKITSNKWFNKYTLFFAGIIIFMIAIMIFAYRAVKQYLVDKTHLIKLIGTIIIVIFTATIGLLIFSGIKTFAALDPYGTEYQSLDKNTMQNINGFVRLPDPAKSGAKYYGIKEPSSDQWGKPQTICFIERIAKEWYDIILAYYKNDKVKVDKGKLIINDISLASGNAFTDHSGHTSGLEFDLWTDTITRYNGSEDAPTLNNDYDHILAQKFADLLNNHKSDFGVNTIYFTQDSDDNKKINGVTDMEAHKVHWHVGLK